MYRKDIEKGFFYYLLSKTELSPAPKNRETSQIREFSENSTENSTEFLAILKQTLRPSSQSWNWVKTSNSVGEN